MKTKITGDKLYCLISVIIILGGYIIQRILHICCDITRTFAICEALIFTVLTAVVFFLITKSKDTFYAILTAIFGFRMMPPYIAGLQQLSAQTNIVYFIVQKFSAVIFVFALIWFYKKQQTKNIKALPILAVLIIVPFFMEMQEQLSEYINPISNGNMLYSYFSGFILYSTAMFILLFVAAKSDFLNSRMVTDYQITALLLNAGRRICAVVINLSQGNHVSRSYYCWIAIYVFFIAAFYVLRMKKQKQVLYVTSENSNQTERKD